MISKLLVEAVLKEDLYGDPELHDGVIQYSVEDIQGMSDNDTFCYLDKSIKINDFITACTEWAISLKYDIPFHTWYSDEGDILYPEKTLLFDMRVEGIENGINCCMYEFNHIQDFTFYHEAIFTACEWILNQTISTKDLE